MMELLVKSTGEVDIIWYIITIVISIIVGIISGLIIELYFFKKTTSKKRMKWKFKIMMQHSVIGCPKDNLKIGTKKGILDSIYKQYGFIEELIKEEGYYNKKLSKKISKFKEETLKTFLSKYHPLISELDKSTEIDKKIIRDLNKLRIDYENLF